MLYVTAINNNTKQYSLFENHTESLLIIDIECLNDLVNKHRMHIKNATLDNGKLKLNKWPHTMQRKSYGDIDNYGLILLAKMGETRFKLTNDHGQVKYINDTKLKSSILAEKIGNCDYISADSSVFRSIDTYEIIKNEQLEDYIAKQYEKYIAKTALLGIDARFTYSIENSEVKITEYLGKSKKLMLPSFVTTILNGVFNYKGINEVNLSEGLKFIGAHAFRDNEIGTIAIPSTVELIGEEAFRGNRELVEVTAIKGSKHIVEFNETKFKLLNNKTIVMDKILSALN